MDRIEFVTKLYDIKNSNFYTFFLFSQEQSCFENFFFFFFFLIKALHFNNTPKKYVLKPSRLLYHRIQKNAQPASWCVVKLVVKRNTRTCNSRWKKKKTTLELRYTTMNLESSENMLFPLSILTGPSISVVPHMCVLETSEKTRVTCIAYKHNLFFFLSWLLLPSTPFTTLRTRRINSWLVDYAITS